MTLQVDSSSNSKILHTMTTSGLQKKQARFGLTVSVWLLPAWELGLYQVGLWVSLILAWGLNSFVQDLLSGFIAGGGAKVLNWLGRGAQPKRVCLFFLKKDSPTTEQRKHILCKYPNVPLQKATS